METIWVFFTEFFFYFLHELKVSLGSLYADLCCSNPLKAQLEYCGFSHHSSRMNVLIILCGHTVGVITIHLS